MVNAKVFSWNDETDSSDEVPSSSLNILKIVQDEKFIKMFTDQIVSIDGHYIKGRGYFGCNGSDCPFCKVGIEKSQLNHTPVYNIDSGEIELLRVPVNSSRNSVQSALKRALKNFEEGDLISVQKEG